MLIEELNSHFAKPVLSAGVLRVLVAVEKDSFKKAMIEFAKLHVTKALTSAHINMQLPIEDLEFTLNSYPLTNIK